MSKPNVQYPRETVLRGIAYFGEQTLDFVDCLLVSYAEAEKDVIFTFNNKLQKLIAKLKKS